jgi:hypothetical protein
MAQVFTCTNIEFVREQMNQMWSDANFKREIQPEVEIVKALKDMQTAKVDMFETSDKKVKVRSYWVEACEGAVQDCTTECDFTGTNVSSACEDFEVEGCKETIFTLDDSDFYDNYVTFNEAVAKGLLKHTTLLDNHLNNSVIASLDSFAGDNNYVNDSRADVQNPTTYIDGPFWTASLMSYFAKVKRKNHMSDAMLFSGENLFDAYWNAQADSANADGKGAMNKFDSQNWVFDIANFDDVLGAKKTLMVSPHAAAFVSYNRVKRNEEITNGADIVRFTVDSMNIPGVKYDVYYRTTCKNAGEDIVHHWRIVARFDTFQSPVVCSATQNNTGIISFECGTAP